MNEKASKSSGWTICQAIKWVSKNLKGLIIKIFSSISKEGNSTTIREGNLGSSKGINNRRKYVQIKQHTPKVTLGSKQEIIREILKIVWDEWI